MRVILTFEEFSKFKIRKLYAGDIVHRANKYDGFVGLSLTRDNENHIKFDITQDFPLPENSIDVFQAEDVFEHIPYRKQALIINRIYSILKPGGLFRLSVPDYNCDLLYKRALYNYKGEIVFDPGGGGTLEAPGHVWFPNYNNVLAIIKNTLFYQQGQVNFLHYYLNRENFVLKKIDYTKGYIARTPDHDKRVQNPVRPMSIVLDCFK
ncbi:MAG TPA: methyltransferase domain-containing protein [Aeromonadales bacterium]|nr:methyltransferase domain-containing protein [Aeromonadales bacterium]